MPSANRNHRHPWNQLNILLSHKVHRRTLSYGCSVRDGVGTFDNRVARPL